MPLQYNSIEELPDDKRKNMVEYAKKLRKQSPGMTAKRITRKVADRFHIKLIQVDLKIPAGSSNIPEKQK